MTTSAFQTTVLDACAQIRERVSEIKGLANPNQYGLFRQDDDPKTGFWLDPARTLEHYLLKENVSFYGMKYYEQLFCSLQLIV
jgi:hypothetical protein